MKQTFIRSLCLLLVSVFALALMPLPVAAQNQGLSQDQKKLFEDGIYHFNFDDDVCQAAATGGGGGIVIDGDNPKTGFLYFVGRGMSIDDSAAVIGNLMEESGEKMDPNISQIGGGPGRGIAQWSVDGRWVTLNNWARSHPNGAKNPLDLMTQLEFVYKELVEDGYNNAYKLMASEQPQGNETVLEAKTRIVMDKYEQAGARQSLPKRQGYALKVKTLYASQAPNAPAPGQTTSEPQGNCAALGGGLATVVDGFAFPLQTTKAVIEGFKSPWCFTKQTNCHHHYNAADIMAPTNTVVVAAKPGTVVYAREVNAGGGSNVTIKGENGDGFIYFYQHLLEGLQVKDGQKVVAGQPLGVVGDLEDADNSIEHLHFDMLPSPPFDYRVNCASGACMSYPFVDVQPILHKVYQALPN